MIHRDVKPGNLLVDRHHNVKLLDVGLARILENNGEAVSNGSAATALTTEDAVFGTVEYMAPEQAISTRQADVRSDIYSLGCTLFYILTGKTPYTHESVIGCLVAHREMEIPRLDELRNDVSPAVAAVFTKMVAKDPDDRHQTASELIDDLERIAIAQKETAASVQWKWVVRIASIAAVAGLAVPVNHFFRPNRKGLLSENRISVPASKPAAGDSRMGVERTTSDTHINPHEVTVDDISPPVVLKEPVPADIEVRFENANGVVAKDFAICQTMTLEDFEAVAESLRPLGYRPVKVRPFPQGLAPVGIAAIWKRDGLPWHMLTRASQTQLDEAHARLQQVGYYPTDLTAYDERNPRRRVYAAVWVNGQTALTDFEFQFSRATPQGVMAHLSNIASDGYVLCSLNRSGGSEPQIEYIVAKAADQEPDAIDFLNLTQEQFRDRDPESLNRRLITEVWTQGAGVWVLSIPSQLQDTSPECRVVVEPSLESHCSLFQKLSDQGWYPLGVSVGFHRKSPLTVSVWHRSK